MIRNARRGLGAAGRDTAGRARRVIERLEILVERVALIAHQTHQRVVRHVTPPGATRVVSLHDPDARPIRKGRLGRPVEFGYKLHLVDNADGIVVDYNVEIGNPADSLQLVPAIERIHTLTGRVPRAVTADKGYGQGSVERELRELGMQQVCIPRQGRPGAARRDIEASRAFQRMIRWRTGAEARISLLKRSYGCRRTHMDTITGARTWTGHGTFAHNLVKVAQLTR